MGTGSFGRVRFATHKANQNCYAIKMLKKSEVVRLQQVEHMLSEKNILKTLSAEPHPFIVNLAATFQDPRYLFMVLEYIVGGGENMRENAAVGRVGRWAGVEGQHASARG